jgi:hypothetical protein
MHARHDGGTRCPDLAGPSFASRATRVAIRESLATGVAEQAHRRHEKRKRGRVHSIDRWWIAGEFHRAVETAVELRRNFVFLFAFG